ncbi:enterotoxin A family protein [Paraburkholderia jirisanensis]
MFQHMRDHLGVGDLVHIRVGAVRPGTSDGRYGHALLLQRLPNSQFALFDPNNGAFLYSSRRDMETALRSYMDDAFSETGLQLRPDSLQFYGRPGPSVGMQITRPQSEAAASLPLPEPPVAGAPAGRETVDAYQRSADVSNSLSMRTLAAAAGQRDALSGEANGLATYALRGITQGRATNLTDVTEGMRERLGDRAQRLPSLNAIRELQQQNPYGLVEPMPGYVRCRGAFDVRSGEGLVADLQQHFGSMHRDSDSRFGYPIDVANISVGFRPQPAADASAARPPEAQPVVVQRLRASPDFRTDPYEVYDPQAGVFHYANFDAMAQAMREMFASGYRERGGVDHIDTTYYANMAAPVADAGVGDAPPVALAANLSMSDIERRLGVIGSPSRATARPDLRPPPLTIEPPAFVLRSDLKRDTALLANPKPNGLFRPATVSPQELRAHGGFDCESTRVADINLALHDHDVAANPRVIDSSGYLGTFRNERTALERMPGESGNGFIYYVAPTPNMVDVPASLGTNTRSGSEGEVAAMGWIDYPQIRGWRVIDHGVPGKYVRNPEYRWDIYDQTRTSGAQPQLARFPVDSSAWRDTPFRPFVSTKNEVGGAVRFNEDPNLTHALFYDTAWSKVRALNGLQSAGLDYRGPLRIQAYEAGDATNTQIFIDQNNAVQIDTQRAPYTHKPGAKHDFAMGNDGRFHLIGNYDKVLRVDHDGYVFLGDTPSDANSLNGVFNHNGHNLIHQEDMKFLTTGKSSYTPFVDAVNHGGRSDWHLHTADGKEVLLPRINAHSFRGSSAGDAQQLYAFYNDPDSALPRNATRFVTKVPDNEYSGNFLHYVDKVTPAQARGAEAWLRSHNAAWLFHDGFYATADEPGVLEVRKLDGTPVWRAEGLTSGGGESNFRTVGALSSSYNMPGETWERVQGRESRYDEALMELNRTTTAST